MRKARKKILMFLAGALLLSVSACSAQSEDAVQGIAPSATVAGEILTENVPNTETGVEEAEGTEMAGAAEALTETGAGNGILTGEGAGLLSEEQQRLIADYMDAYFDSVSALEIDAGLAELFAEPDGLQAWMNEKGLEYLIGIRSLQPTDLTLASYYYELSVTEVNEADDGSVEVLAEEWNRQNFTQHPQVDSEQYGISHRFVLTGQNGEWKIQEHLQRDGIYWHLFGEYWGQPVEDIPDARNYLQERVDALVEETQAQLGSWKEGTTTASPQYENAYDAEAAVAYAGEWVGRRNEEWADYSGRGGNCQNFVSQCLLAGGIPMDREGNAVWKWYGEDPDNSGSAEGRSPSWTGVDEFYQYAAENEGFGLVAAVDYAYEEGEAGDLIRLGFPDNWNHVVMITDVIRDEEGRTVDYLIDSNTSDMHNFPVSAYPLPCRSLIKIYGWNG